MGEEHLLKYQLAGEVAEIRAVVEVVELETPREMGAVVEQDEVGAVYSRNHGYILGRFRL